MQTQLSRPDDLKAQPPSPAKPPTFQELRSLAPTEQIRPRPQRYIGNSVTASITALGEKDAAIVRSLYQFLSSLHAFLGARDLSAAETYQEVKAFVQDRTMTAALDAVGELGTSLRADTTPEEVRRVLHDIRGGSLAALIAHLDFVALDYGGIEDVERSYVLSRDHLKIMRNSLYDLDPEGYERDLMHKLHGVDLLREKWSDIEYRMSHSGAQVVFYCEFSGAVAECCMEFAALDRVIYNLINNAAQHSADRVVHFAAFPINDAADTHLRFCVMNRISEEHRQTLNARFQGDFGQLFSGGFTTGGHGLGMGICGDFVAHGYGLKSLDEALSKGYLGADLVGDYFVTFFHWPARAA